MGWRWAVDAARSHTTMSDTVLVAYCTCPDAETAATVSRTLVERRVAACVNVLPSVRSWYHWQGRVECDDETLLVIKTTAGCMPQLLAAIEEIHPYDVPELVAARVEDGLPAYLDWVRENVRQDRG